MSAHVGDDAELYALGMLEPEERERIEAHLATCGECSRAVGEAERTALALANATWTSAESASQRIPQRATTPSAASGANATRTPKNAHAPWYAVAAAFALFVGIGGTLATDDARRAHANSEDDAAFANFATSHFLHASFARANPHAPPAKAIYARLAASQTPHANAWAYVIVDGDATNWHLYDTSQTEPRDLGTFEPRGRTAILAIHPAQRLQSLEIRDASGTIEESLKLVYPPQ